MVEAGGDRSKVFVEDEGFKGVLLITLWFKTKKPVLI